MALSNSRPSFRPNVWQKSNANLLEWSLTFCESDKVDPSKETLTCDSSALRYLVTTTEAITKCRQSSVNDYIAESCFEDCYMLDFREPT